MVNRTCKIIAKQISIVSVVFFFFKEQKSGVILQPLCTSNEFHEKKDDLAKVLIQSCNLRIKNNIYEKPRQFIVSEKYFKDR